MNEKTIVIFTALQIETKAVQRALAGIRRPVYVHTIGIRAIRVPTVLPKNIGVMIVAGLGGALDPALKVGDVVIDDPHEMVPAEPSLRRGKICTVDAIVATPAEKAALFASTSALAVDMEQQHLQRLAERRRVALIGVRAISDTAAHAINPNLLRLVDAVGRPKPVALAAAIFEKPTLVLEMSKLAKDVKLATDQLGAAMRTIVQSLPM
jgi:hypothetical protein